MKLYYLVFLCLVACGNANKGNDPSSTGGDSSYTSPGSSSTNQEPGKDADKDKNKVQTMKPKPIQITPPDSSAVHTEDSVHH